MKIIYPDNYASSFESEDEDSSYPASNLENNYASEVFKSESNTGTVRCAVAAGANAIGIARTNATSITVTLLPVGAIEWSSDDNVGVDWTTAEGDALEVVWETDDGSVSTVYDISSSDIGQLYGSWTAYDVAVNLSIDFTAASGTIVEAGAVRVGVANTFRDPLHPVDEGFNDYSTRMRLDSGGQYVEQGDIERTLGLTILETRDNIWSMMYDIFFLGGPGPYFFRIVDVNKTDWEWIIFAWLDEAMPSINHAHPDHSEITILLTEAI